MDDDDDEETARVSASGGLTAGDASSLALSGCDDLLNWDVESCWSPEAAATFSAVFVVKYEALIMMLSFDDDDDDDDDVADDCVTFDDNIMDVRSTGDIADRIVLQIFNSPLSRGGAAASNR